MPAWISLQGRVLVEGQPFQGWGEFKFALLSGGSPAGVIWHQDGTAPAEAQPETAVPLWVTNGLFQVGLGDTTLTNMAALPASLGGLPDLQVRVWFSDGVHGWQQLAPDLRLGAVPYALNAAQVPAQTITLSHLAPEVQARLAATNTTGGLPAGALLPAPLTQASNLAQAGYARFPLAVAQAAWQTDYLDPRLTPAFLSAPGTNLWDGQSLWLWRWPVAGQAGQGARYEADAGRWYLLSPTNAPIFDPSQSWAMTWAGDLMVIAADANGWQASRYRRAAQAWEDAPMPGSLPWPAVVRLLDTPFGAVVLAAAESRLAGAWREPEEDRWQAMDTNGAPALEWSTVQFAGLTNGWLAMGTMGGEVQLWRYQVEPPGWHRLSVAGFSLPWSSQWRAVWTGTEWYWLAVQDGHWRGFRYALATGQWQPLPALDAPLAHEATQCLWNGQELLLVNLSAVATETVHYSARFNPALHRWQPMNPAAPISAFGPSPHLLTLPDALLMARVSDPSRYALYDYEADRWRPLEGPNLGFEALVVWSGKEVLALPYQPLPEEPLFLHRYTPPQRVGWFYRPEP
ncbi:hypothetical protein NXS98_12410 [Fontisphaera persica]|uniref:hypothetical protein n=1 Tax=Fontisphaera persica TaxID=2974023 RepID=UPI0024BF114F|nr:hypothetical protein [Fontisphaera persica]WCJ58519.1 hypothetical protein NXS98_12410 [Fontisphaera persica]